MWAYGVLAWGVPTGVLFSLGMWWIASAVMSRIAPEVEVRYFGPIALSVPAFAIGGYFWGASMWKSMESMYSRYVKGTGQD